LLIRVCLYYKKKIQPIFSFEIKSNPLTRLLFPLGSVETFCEFPLRIPCATAVICRLAFSQVFWTDLQEGNILTFKFKRCIFTLQSLKCKCTSFLFNWWVKKYAILLDVGFKNLLFYRKSNKNELKKMLRPYQW